MAILHNTIVLKIAESIKAGLDATYPDHGLSLEEVYGHIGEPPNLKMGHFAFPCFPLAKTCRMAPNMIAKKVSENVPTDDLLIEAKDVGPYLNVTLGIKALGDLLIAPIISGDFFTRKKTDLTPKTMIEYSQPNTHKEMHVGHMRNLCLGNALVRIKKYCDQDVHPVTYPGDVGTHVAKCLWYVKYHNDAPMPETADQKAAWLGSMYTKGNLKLKDELGTEKEEENRAQLTAILKELESGSGPFYDQWVETRQWSLDLMNHIYDWADVKFDRWFFESEVDTPSLKIARELFEQGKLEKSQGAIGMNLEEDKLGFCLLIKTDGTGLYATKDVALAKKKFEEFGVEKNIYIVDNRQAFHFKQVFKVLEKIGFEQAKDCYHLEYEMVELPDGAMSSRKGNIVPLMDLVKKMQSTIITDYLEKYRGEWSDEEITNSAKIIANGAIKYGMVRVDNNRKIIFDMKEWLKLDGETGPYLQYVYARINSLCEKLNFDPSKVPNYEVLTKNQEIALALKISRFNDIALTCHKQNKTILLTTYLFELGKSFNSFYAECSIGNADTQDLKDARLALAKSAGLVMQKGLSLLGIETPNRM